MNPDHVERALAGLPRFDSDERRAARTRSLCQAALQCRKPSADRATHMPPVVLAILQPVAIAACFVFLAMVLGHAVRVVTFIPW